MKVSEITNKEIADYLRIDYTSLTDSEKTDLNTLLGVAKAFIRSYTGLEDSTVEGEVVGTGDGDETVFYLANKNIISGSQTIYVDKIAKVLNTDYTFDAVKGKIAFLTAPETDAEITADYSTGIDAFEDFVIVVYVLVQDMYDNRTLYIDKNNLNRVVDTILGMHSVNLL